MFSWRRFINSFRFAFRGFLSMMKAEQNFRLHVLAALVVVFFATYFQISIWQWCLIVLMITAVFVLEIMNTIFERLVDMFKPRLHEYVGEIKDMMSATVLVTAMASVIIAVLIFLPYLLN